MPGGHRDGGHASGAAHAGTDAGIQTPGGVFSARWDERGSATALGQLAFFAEYLEATGLFERWLKRCPLSYTSPNAPELVDVLGTWMRRSWTGTAAMPTWAPCAAMA